MWVKGPMQNGFLCAIGFFLFLLEVLHLRVLVNDLANQLDIYLRAGISKLLIMHNGLWL